MRPDLAGAFMEFGLEAVAQGFIATQVLKPIEVASAAGQYPKITREYMLKVPEVTRRVGGA